MATKQAKWGKPVRRIRMQPNRLRDARKRRGLSQEEVAEKMNLSPSQVSRHEAGKSELTMSQLKAYATLYGCSVVELLTEQRSGGVVMVKGAVQAGAWVESLEWPHESWYSVPVPADPENPRSVRYGLEVRGPSMNLEYPEGTILVCIPVGQYDHGIGDGDHVVVERRNELGLHEATVKELRIDDAGRAWLWPRSDHPEFQAPIELPTPATPEAHHATGVDDIRVTGIVVGAYKRKRTPKLNRRLLG